MHNAGWNPKKANRHCGLDLLRIMKKLDSLNDLEGIRRSLEATRLNAERAQQQAQAKQQEREKEANLFKSQMQGVTPLPANNRKIHAAPPPPPVARQRALDDDAVLEESLSDEMDVERFLDTDEQLSYRRNGISPDTLRRLRKGHWVVQAQIDLHGYRSDEARQALSEFIHRCRKREIRCIRVIHGKGLGSVGKNPVLKEKVKRWLVQKDDVLAFCQAPPRDGGSGALLVILKASSNHQNEM